MKKLGFLVLVLGVLLAGCVPPGGASAPAATATVSAPASPMPTAQLPAPTNTPAPSPSPDATSAPTAAAGEPVTILRIEMMDGDNGWAVGETAPGALQRVLTSADGGATWQDVTPVEKVSTPAADTAVLAAFSGLDRAWAIWFAPLPAPGSEAMVVWRTTDRGQSWTPAEPLVTADLMMDFFLPGELGFADEQNGWLLAHLGAGMNHDYVALYRTADAGETWTRAVDPEATGDLPMSCAKTGVAFVDEENGWMAGNCNGVVPGVFLYRTQDGGSTWTAAELPDPAGQPGLLGEASSGCGSEAPVFETPEEGTLPVVCLLADGSSQRWLYDTSDGGQSWTPEPAPLPFGALEFSPAGNAWLLGSAERASEEPRTLFASPDGGETWSEVLAGVEWDGQLNFVDAQNGWAAARFGDETRLLRTGDGGRTWAEVNPRVVLRYP